MSTGVPLQIIDTGPISTAVLSVDAVMRETYGFESRVSKFPVEDGSTISDNIINDQPSVSMTCIVTETPVVIVNPSLVQEIADRVAAGQGETVTSYDPSAQTAAWGNAPLDCFNRLLAIRAARQLVTLITGLQRMENMALSHLAITRDKSTNGILSFDVRFEQFTIVASQSTTFPALREGKTKDQGSVKDAGKQSTTPVVESTLARSVRNGVYKFFGKALTPVQEAGGVP